MEEVDVREMPLCAALAKHVAAAPAAFHVPAHKGGRGLPPEFVRFVGRGRAMFDLSEVEGLDCLHRPSGPIRDAEAGAARWFEAAASVFTTGGTGLGLAALVAAAAPGRRAVVARNVHSGAVWGMVAADVEPVFVMPPVEPESGAVLALTPGQVAGALDAHQDVVAVVLVSPTRYGFVADLPRIARACQRRGVALIVDETYATHAWFGDVGLTSARTARADGSVLGLFGLPFRFRQACLVNLYGGRVDAGRIRAWLNLLHTTSPSYVGLATLDAARWSAARWGAGAFQAAVDLAQQVRAEVSARPPLRCLGPVVARGQGGFDPTKLAISVAALGLSGAAARRLLRGRGGPAIDGADACHLLAHMGVGDTREKATELVRAARWLAEGARFRPPRQLFQDAGGFTVPRLARRPRQAVSGPNEVVPVEAAGGRVCAEVVVRGMSDLILLCPGEVVTEEVKDLLLSAEFRGRSPQADGHPGISVCGGGEKTDGPDSHHG